MNINPGNPDEETKVVKQHNKRGRPRKNPLVLKEEPVSGKKRGRKPKKLYDNIDSADNKIKLECEPPNVYDLDNDDDNDDRRDSDLGPIAQNLKMLSHDHSPFDQIINDRIDGGSFGNSHSIFPRKQSTDNPFDKFFSMVPNNMGVDNIIREERSRRVSTASPYNIPSNPPNIVSPIALRGNTFGTPINPPQSMNRSQDNSNDESMLQKRLNDIIAQSFNNWNSKPKRKDTEDIDFSRGDHQIHNKISNSSGVVTKNNPLDFITNAMMSPMDFKPRKFSTNGWSMANNIIPDMTRKRSGVDQAIFGHTEFDIRRLSMNNIEFKEDDNRSGSKPESLECKIAKEITNKLNAGGLPRKSTMIPNPAEFQKNSPLFNSTLAAAFKPFKKRSHSFHISPDQGMDDKSPDVEEVKQKKRDAKGHIKVVEELEID
jgi:hypothetical protein